MKEFHNYIDGEWVGSTATMGNINPSDTGDEIGHYCVADAGQAQEAVAAAANAIAQNRSPGIQGRSEILDTIGSEILARRDGTTGKNSLGKSVNDSRMMPGSTSSLTEDSDQSQ